MKSSRYLLAVAALALGFAGPLVRAADDATPPAKKEGGRARPELKEALGLTAEQDTKVKAIQAEGMKKAAALAKEDRRTEGPKIRAETDAKIEAVLTAEQKAKYETIKAERAKRGGPKGDKGDKPKHDEAK